MKVEFHEMSLVSGRLYRSIRFVDGPHVATFHPATGRWHLYRTPRFGPVQWEDVHLPGWELV